MALITQLTDRFILTPSTHRILALGKDRRVVDANGRQVEVWAQRNGLHSSDEADVFILTFLGTGGRAERATDYPMNYWEGLKAEAWAVNPPGYGGSPGRATIQSLAEVGRAVYDEIASVAMGRPIVIVGNSLGTITALHVASRRKVAGLILRNPPPLRRTIMTRFGWRTLWLGAALVASQVPAEIDSIRNAAKVSVPAMFVTSGKDRTVPPHLQQKVIDAYAGEKRVLFLRNGRHATMPNAKERIECARLLAWLRDSILRGVGRVQAATEPMMEAV